jgi:hypothetical protein
MPQSLEQLEADIEQLSLADQINLMERLIKLVRQRAVQPVMSDNDIAFMAQDPDIQREIAAVDAEFAHTEMDGLDAHGN